jgi:excinuclease ABC subunit C
MNKFKEKLALVPTKPGSYQMKNSAGLIIYVGKAKNLKNRLKSYFTGTVTGKTAKLVEDVADFEYIITSSELESLILEITLIKKYNPKYNILLKDDKTYPYIELTKEKYPRLKIIRNTKRKKLKDHLYGPYPNVYAARKTVNMINRLYPLRKCEHLPKELCLYYHIGECLGYCTKDIDPVVINNMTKEIITFLKGDSTIIRNKIVEKMESYSKHLNYEKAQEMKVMLDDIDITLRKQKIDLNHNYNFDLVNFYQDKNYLGIEVFFIRNGLLFGRHNDIISTLINSTDQVIEYLIKFYNNLDTTPKELYIPSNLDSELLSNYFHIKVTTPRKGKLKKLLDLAYDNAKEDLLLNEETITRKETERLEALKELQDLLHLKKLSRMESFDNSHLFGTYYVGGMVSFVDFLPDKDNYRKFKLALDVTDDLKAMHEVIYRRYYRLLMDNEAYPDLIVMDGGKTQIGVAKEVLASLHINIPIIGLVKDKTHKTSYIMNDQYEILPVKENSSLFLFLTQIQEEVHRYAISYHRNIKAKGALASTLDMIPGVGAVRRKELLKEFGSLKKIKEASLEDLSKVVGLNNAKNIKTYLTKI